MSLMPISAPFSDAPVELVAVTTNGTYPTVQDGDFGILMALHSVFGFATSAEVPFLSIWPSSAGIIGHSSLYTTGTLWGRISCSARLRELSASLSGTSIGSEAASQTLLVFRHPRNRSLTWSIDKASEDTHSFNGPVQFGSVVSPIVPMFFAAKILFGANNVLLAQSQPEILFDGSPVTYHGATITGASIRAALLTGRQSPRQINVALDAANPGANTQRTRHAAIHLRRRMTI